MKNGVTKDGEFNKIKYFYTALVGFYELVDKLFGSTFIAFMINRNLSVIQISNLFSIEQLLSAVFDYPTGNISDLYGRKKVSGLGFIIWGLGLIVFSQASGYSFFLSSMVLMALGVALISGSPEAWLVDEMIINDKYEERTKILPRIDMFVMLFSVVGAIGSSIITLFNNSLPMLLGGIIAIIIGIIAINVMDDNYGSEIKDNILKNITQNTKSFFGDKKLVILLIKDIVLYCGTYFFILNWQIYAINIVNIKENYFGVIMIIMMLILTISRPVTLKMIEVIDKFKVSIIGILICSIGYIVLFYIHNIISFLIGVMLIELGIGIEQSATSTWLCDFISSKSRASHMSVFSSLKALSGFIIINFIGLCIDTIGSANCWIVGAVFIWISMLILLYFIKNYKRDTLVESGDCVYEKRAEH